MAKILRIFCVASGVLALLLLAAAGPSYRFDLLELGQAFTLLRGAAILGITAVVATLIYGLWRRPKGAMAWGLGLSALCGLSAAIIPLSQLQTARSVPAIHDITTDVQDPPEFVDIVPLREHAPNPPQYAGEETARQQQQAYPDLKPAFISAPLEQVYQRAQEVAQDMDWHLVAADRQQDRARIEATDTTFWFGFKDDVVVRLQSTSAGTRVDVRSKSRVGKSDLGKNAERIHTFMQKLKQRVQQE